MTDYYARLIEQDRLRRVAIRLWGEYALAQLVSRPFSLEAWLRFQRARQGSE